MRDSRLAALQRHYTSSLPDKLATLRGLRDDLRAGYEAADARVRAYAHKLVGSGASFGFGNITDSARSVEHAAAVHLPGALDGLIDLVDRIHRDATLLQSRILIVEDDMETAQLIQECFRPLVEDVHIAASGIAAHALLAHLRFDVVVLDLMLPDVDGRALLRELREREDTQDLPVIVLTAKGSPSVRTECINVGVDHFIDKPVDEGLVRAAVKSSVNRASRRRAAARIDPLTGLPGRAVVHEIAPRGAQDRLVAVIDIEALDSVNAVEGYAVGDVMLRTVAGELRQALKPGEDAIRWGGDEFLVVLEDDLHAATQRLEVLCDRLLEADPPVPVTAGLTRWAAADSLDAALSAATRLIDLTRRHGAGRVGVQTPAGDRKILLVEDDDDAVALARTALDDLGAVTVCGRADEAIVSLASGPWNLIVLDWQLTHGTGEEVLRALQERGSGEPVLLLAAVGDATISKALALGTDDYVQKPYVLPELADRARRLLVRLRAGEGPL